MFRAKEAKLRDAAGGGDLESVLELLSKNANPDDKDKHGYTALHHASLFGNHVDVVQALLRSGAHVNEADEFGKTALHLAADEGSHDVVVALLKHGVAVNVQDGGGDTALHIAVTKGRKDVVQTLLKNGAYVNVKDLLGRTPLHKAAKYGSCEISLWLLNGSATIDEKDKDGQSPLYYAARRGHLKVVQFLLDKKAAVNEKTDHGETAHSVAVSKGHADIAAVLTAALQAHQEQELLWQLKQPVTQWFFGEIGRDDAALLIADVPAGAFVVRASSQANSFAITFKRKNLTIDHGLLQQFDQGWAIGGLPPYEATLEALLKALERQGVLDFAQLPRVRTNFVHKFGGRVSQPTTTSGKQQQPQQQQRQQRAYADVPAQRQPRQPQPEPIDPIEQQSVDGALDIASVVALQQSVRRASRVAAPSSPAVLEVDWQLVMSKSGLQNQLASMQASIAANERAQHELRAADAQLDKRVAANAARIAEHQQRLAELEERRHIQSAQLDILRDLQNKPAQLLFYRTLLINIEAVFVSCKAAMGGFVDLGGDAASNKALTGAAKATKVCGAVLSLLPGGALIKGAANLTAAAFEQANAARRQNIVTQLSKSVTQAEASQVASDVAHRLTVAFATQLEMLAPVEQTGEGNSGGSGFMSFLKTTCGVGGRLAAAFVTSGGDGSEVIATAMELAQGAASEQQATDLLATKFGALVGSVDNGPDPFASVLADFCFLCALAELENVRARETPNEIAERLVRAVLDLKPAAAASGNESGARRLLNRVRGVVNSALSNAPSRSLSVFIRGAPWREVSVFDLLTRCGVRTKTGHLYSAAHCDTAVFGWCEASEEQAGRRGLAVVAAAPAAGGPRGAAADLAREAHVKAVVRSELKTSGSQAVRANSVDSAARNEFRGVFYGRCTQCKCDEYIRPKDGARCEACDCAAMKHVELI